MARIRFVEIRNFRSIRSLDWTPSAGINCLIGPGDSGKSSILDAIDLCLGARRSLAFSDTDFYLLDVTQPISITLTLGELPDNLKNLDTYGDFLRGFDANNKTIEDEPRTGLETVLTFRLIIDSSLEPVWSLYSIRAEQQEIERSLAWKDRTILAPARIGGYTNSNLSWTRTSILNKLLDAPPNLGAELAVAARDARTNFGTRANAQLADTLRLVTRTANNLGVPVGEEGASALLDAHSVSIGDGAIALHNDHGVPLRALGTGSSRLLVAGLQRAAAQAASIALVDEVEHGLEPHRVMRLLDSLGAKEADPPLQVFMTTHSPIVVRELSGGQVGVLRIFLDQHKVCVPGTSDDIQGALRSYPEAFLARSVIVCEGASEVGLVRGLDQFWSSRGGRSMSANAVSYINAGGSEPDIIITKGLTLSKLGYRVLVLIDADKPHSQPLVDQLQAAGGSFLIWRAGRTLEDELFLSSCHQAVTLLIQSAICFLEEDLVRANIQSESNGAKTLDDVLGEPTALGNYSDQTRILLGKASRNRRNSWFKSVSRFEVVSKEIVGPSLAEAEDGFIAIVRQMNEWIHAS